MKTNKNEHFKLEKNSSLYFAIGLTLVLSLIYTVLEWKTFDNELGMYKPDTNLDELNPEIPPNTLLVAFKTPPPPLQKQIDTDILKIIKDDELGTIETLIKPSEPIAEQAIIEAKNINFEEPIITDQVPFIIIEDVPIFPGCEDVDDKRACFQEKMLKHIKDNFRYPSNAIDLKQQGRVNVVFTIQKDGTIGDVKMRSPHKILEKEASRIIAKLPKMTPGMQRKQPVKVPFSIPITFKLE